MEKKFADIGKAMGKLGQKLSLTLTAPLAAAGIGIIKASGDFEAGLGRIQVATEATAGEMKQMADLALQIGKDTTFGASEAAGAMEMLAKAGVGTETILGGAAEAVTNLAAAAGSELDPAASAISDSMNQFHLAAKDLPTIVNQITGAVNESKFDFEDFTNGMAQGGGVAASAGLSFKDFAATLAATSSQFSSGQDAGTSLKTFLLSLTPTTKKAAEAMAQYGLTFFDAAGKMRPMAEIAEMLRVKFAGLSDEARNAAFKEIFGTDAIRTAVGLMNQGADGLDRIQAKLDATNAGEQAAKRMAGFNGQLEQLKGSLETLAIKIGQSGILEIATQLVTSFGGLVDKLSVLDPAVLKFAFGFGLVVAAVGPLLIGLGAVVSAIGVMLPAIVAVGGAIATLSSIIVAGAIPAIASLVVALSPILIPLGLVAAAIGAVYLAWKNWDKIVAIVNNLVGKIEPLIGGRLASVLKAVLNPIEAVRKAFAHLYDAVVGRSYIPDMVDGIAAQMARLDAVMVNPAKTAAERTKQQFEKLASDVDGIMRRLYPDAAATAGFAGDRAKLNAGIAAGGASGYTPPQLQDALKALQSEEFKDAFKDFQLAANDTAAVVGTANVRIVESFRDMADKTIGALQGLANSIKGGGFLDILGSVIGLGLQLGSVGLFGKSVQTSINKAPGFASGTASAPRGLALVGERGPELVKFKGGERVYTNSQSERMGRGGGRQVVEIVDTTGLFRFAVNGQIMQTAPAIADAGSDLALRKSAYSNSRRLA